ncbi:TIGR02757 family protein [Chryseobacterium suipulveris]|uniref:TIGR02757 family protein n=1 Tax=Chryseobacterium suipulveris TaxID=2929800 RepID=A0ABY4BP56_9FLAO|nr:TIGR02757 family protein [Chryseobacterium suipulveris]UOE40022.1 TIGR02757 family protein [Chryseobacterium suipulveris]
MIADLKEFLDEKADFYNRPEFIENDPIQIPHRFSLMQDIEIAGFLTATISWGNRKSIINDAAKMMELMENSPYDFVQNVAAKELRTLENKSIHRTFNGEDFREFILNLKKVYSKNESLEQLFLMKEDEENFFHALERFRNSFLGAKKHRSHKHVSSTYKNSSAKRLMMFLRWMVRKDKRGVDFGVWRNIDQQFLSVPLDVHTGNISRKLNLIERKQNDWKTVLEMDSVLRKFDAEDPAKYDFALFGIGVSKDF